MALFCCRSECKSIHHLACFNIYNIIVYCYNRSFISSFLDVDDNNIILIDIFIDLAFIVDFYMNLNLAYYNEDGVLVKEKKQIASKYLKGWMIIDACSSVPLGIINLIQGSRSYVNGLIKLVRLRNLPKLLKLGKIIKIINRLLDFEDMDYFFSKHHNLIRFINLLFQFFYAFT